MHVVNHLVKVILSALGMTDRERAVTFVALMLLAFALYAGKQFATQKVLATLYLITGLAFCVFMTTDRAQTRLAAGTALCAAIAAMFGWYFATRALGRGDPSREG